MSGRSDLLILEVTSSSFWDRSQLPESIGHLDITWLSWGQDGTRVQVENHKPEKVTIRYPGQGSVLSPKEPQRIQEKCSKLPHRKPKTPISSSTLFLTYSDTNFIGSIYPLLNFAFRFKILLLGNLFSFLAMWNILSVCNTNSTTNLKLQVPLVMHFLLKMY